MDFSYQYYAEPRPLASKPKYRPHPQQNEEFKENNQIQQPQQSLRPLPYENSNIMYDKRVKRGTTRPPVSPANLAATKVKVINQKPKKSNEQIIHTTNKTMKMPSSDYFERPLTPEPVAGRVHCTIQTETYLEDLRVKQNSNTIETQTNEEELEKPPSPIFKPQSSGDDIETQIDIKQGELFDFDNEIDPLLQVLIQNSLEQSLFEVCEETELKLIELQKIKYLQKKNQELMELQQLQGMEQRKQAEIEKRKLQAEEKILLDKQAKEAEEAKNIAKQLLIELKEDVVENLRKQGYFYDPIEKEVKEIFLPHLLDNIVNQLNQREKAAELINSSIKTCIENIESNREQSRILRLREEKEDLIQTFIRNKERKNPAILTKAEENVRNEKEWMENLNGLNNSSNDSNVNNSNSESDISEQSCIRLDVIRSNIKDSLAQNHRFITIQSLVRGQIARNTVKNKREQVDLENKRLDMNPIELLKSIQPDLGLTLVKNPQFDGLIIDSIDLFGPACQTSLNKGDRIIRINDKPIDSINNIISLLNNCLVGDLLNLTVNRGLDQREEIIKLELGNNDGNKQFNTIQIRDLRIEAGLKINHDAIIESKEEAMEILEKLGVKLGCGVEEGGNGRNGVKINEIKESSGPYRAGLRIGDVIISISEQKVNTVDQVKKVIKKHKAGDKVNVECWKDGDSNNKHNVGLELSGVNKKATVEWIRNVRRMAGLTVEE